MLENKALASCRRGGINTKKDNASSKTLVSDGPPKGPAEIIHENKMTTPEEVNLGIYFSYPCQRHSCSLVNIPAPCVNKMVSHIEEVESKIQEHLKRFETSLEEWSRIIPVPIEGVKPEKEHEEKCPELKQKMESLLSEAIHLIKSLETDRADAEEALNKQKSRKKMINLKIDSWALWRLQEIPIAVQKEHEAYLRDIVELQWLLEADAHELKHFEEQKRQLEEANSKLQSDIDYMQKQDPLLLLKRNQELETLKEYYRKKFEVLDKYKQVHEELEEATQNCEDAKLNAKNLVEEMKTDIAKTEISIEEYKKRIEKLDILYNQYCKSIENININIEKDEEAVTEVIKETKTSKDELASLAKLIHDLKKAFEQLTLKKKEYESEYMDVVNDFYITKRTWDTEISDISKDLSDLSNAYAEIEEENKRMEIDIETITGYINDSVEKKAEFESDIQKLMKTIIKNDDYLKYLYREAYHIGAVYHLTKFKSEELENKIAEVRRKFKYIHSVLQGGFPTDPNCQDYKKSILTELYQKVRVSDAGYHLLFLQSREDFLKVLTRSKVATGMMIQKRLLSIQDTAEFERDEMMRKKMAYTQALSELETPLHELEEDAQKIRAIHEDHFDTLNDIIEKRKHVKQRVEKTKKKLRRKGKKTQHALIENEEKNSEIYKQIESAKSKTVIFHSKIIKLNKDLKEKESEKNDFCILVEKLKDEFTTMRYKKEHAQAVFEHLLSEKKACRYRIYVEEERFRLLHNMRQKTLAEIKKIQDDALDENLRLAQEYQRLQMIFLTEKDNYLNQYDRQLSLDASIRDEKQLSQLQRKIHKVWQKHFKLVVLYSQMRLAKFQIDSHESIQKILAVQEESSNLMQHILDFFQTLTDSPCENDG